MAHRHNPWCRIDRCQLRDNEGRTAEETTEMANRYRCPYDGCTFEGDADEVDEHRSAAVRPGGAHADQPQAGSNLPA